VSKHSPEAIAAYPNYSQNCDLYDITPEMRTAFDRGMAAVRESRDLAEVKADAWDEGVAAQRAQTGLWKKYVESADQPLPYWLVNPYRAEVAP